MKQEPRSSSSNDTGQQDGLAGLAAHAKVLPTDGAGRRRLPLKVLGTRCHCLSLQERVSYSTYQLRELEREAARRHCQRVASLPLKG